MITPAYLGAFAGVQAQAGQVNQFLGTHPTQYLYAATLQASQIVAGSTSTAGNGIYIAQRFTAGASQTTIGYISIPLTTTTTSGSLLAPTTVSIYTDNSGVPSSTILASTTVTAEYANLASGGTATVLLNFPIPLTGLTAAGHYWIVVAPAGTAGNHFTWYQSNQVSGAFTSTNGTSWTTQAYGLLFEVFDQTASGQLVATWEDSGARWSAMTYNTTANINQITTLAEYTVAQGSSQYVQSFRTFTYSNGLLVKAA